MRASRLVALAAVVGLASGSSLARGATISYVGAQLDMEPHTNTGGDPGGWRTVSTPHSYLVGSNTIYGTDGYSLLAISSTYTSRPSYVSGIAIAAAQYGGNPAYAPVDDPTNSSNPDVTTGAAYYNGVTPGTELNMFSFTLQNTVPDRVRIGLLFDATDGTQTNIQFQVTGGSGDSGLVTQAAAGNGKPDWYFFDIVGGVAGDAYTVAMKNNGTVNQGLQVGGIAFDSSPIPEPGSIGLIGIVGGLMLRRRRA